MTGEFWDINVGHVASFISVVCAMIWTAGGWRAKVQVMDNRLERVEKSMDAIVSNLESVAKELAGQAVQSHRLMSVEQAVEILQRDRKADLSDMETRLHANLKVELDGIRALIRRRK